MDSGPLHCLVVDFGECYSKIGDGSEEAPRIVVPSTYAKRSDEFVMWASGPKLDYYFGYDADKRDRLIEKKSFFGTGAHKTLRPGVSEQVGHFLHSTFLDWFDSAEPTHGAVLLLDKPDSCVATKRELATSLFESSKFQKFLMLPDYVASLYSTGKSTGAVVSCGYSTTYAAAVMNGVPSPFGIAEVSGGAKRVEAAYTELLRDILFRQKNPDYKWVGEVQGRKFLEDHGRVAHSDSTVIASVSTTVTLPDGTQVSIDTESLTQPFEAYFTGVVDPHSRAAPQQVRSGMTTAVKDSVNQLLLTAADSITRYQKDQLLGNLVLEGGITKCDGFYERTVGELNESLSQHKPKVQSGADRLFVPWTGAAKLKDWIEDGKLWYDKSTLQDKGMERVLAEIARSF